MMDEDVKFHPDVPAIVTNSTNAVVIALATISIGGIFSSTATDMGTEVGI
jgi:acetoacetyl-CoA synthetase